jgi:cysteine desulfurase family protein (TIGR01976 family)
MSSSFDVAAARQRFPALNQPQVFMDNAGGSQVLSSVIDGISSYLSTTNVQLGATYPVAQKSTNAYDRGVEAAAKYINAAPSEVVLGPSTTQLFHNLSIALNFPPGSEIILSNLDHEANLAPWVQLASWKNLTVKWWIPSASKTNPILEPADLKKLLTPKTRLVCCTHTSNILGSITNVAAIAETVHTIPGAMLCIDAVAYAPHRAIDVKALGVDLYSFSWYKVYGPHIAMLYASRAAQKEIVSLGHYFKSGETLEEKLGLGGANYEVVQSLPQVIDYLASQPWENIKAHEEKIQEILLSYLRSRDDVQIYGEPSADPDLRVPVLSFVVKGRSSEGIVTAVEERSNYGIRSGHFYSKRLCNDVLGLDGDDGVVRVSLLHYNTEDEVRGLVKVLDDVLKK